MSKLLLSAAAAALMTAPALAQSDATQQQAGPANDAAQASATQTASAQDFDWRTDHDWVHAAVYGEDGEQVGIVNRVRMRGAGDGVRAFVLDTSGYLDQGMRHIRLLGDEATVITQDALPEGWTVNRAGQNGEDASGEDEGDGERRWWNWGRDDEDGDQQAANARGGMDSLTLIALDFTNDEIGMMPEFTAAAEPQATASANATASDDQVRTASAEDAGREDSREATQMAAQNARDAASDDQDGSAVAMESANGGEMDEETSDAYDREVRAGREDYGANNDTGVNMQNGDRPDDVADSAMSGETDSPSSSEAMNAGAADMDETAADASGSQTTSDQDTYGEDAQSAGATGRSQTTETEEAADPTASADDGDDTGSDASAYESSWTEDDTLVGQDVYAQDETRLGSVSRVQQDGEGGDAEPIALIIITDTMGERSVSLEDRDWTNEPRDGEDSLTLDYQDQSEFEQNSAAYGDDAMTEDSDPLTRDSLGENTAQGDQPYGEAETDTTGTDSSYGSDAEETTEADDQWTDDHDWVDTPVYSRTGSQIGEIERVRGGADGAQPTAVVIETSGFLDLGGREVELNGSNFRLTDYEGDEVLQIRYTEDEIEQMPSFNEAETSEYPLSDNPLEDDESEPFDGDGR